MLFKKYNTLREAITKENEAYRADNPEIIRSELASLQALNPFIAYVSASRSQMVASHLEGSIRTKEPTKRKCYTGYEIEYGKTTYQIKAPCDLVVIWIETQYGNHLDNVSPEDNPETLVIYESLEDRSVGLLKIPTYLKTSEQFGVFFRINESLGLRKGMSLMKDTVLAISESVDSDGTWRAGTELNVAYMADPRVLQDGIVMSESAAKKLCSRGIGSRTFSMGASKFPLNIYGDSKEYKIIPDIGEYVADHRMIAAFRRKDPLMAPIKLAPGMLRLDNFDPLGDEGIYIGQGERNARVIDIRVHYQSPDGQPLTPVGMADQLDRYRDSRADVSLRMYNFYRHLRKNNPNLTITPELQNELMSCIAKFKSFDKSQRYSHGISDLFISKLMLSGSLLDEYHVEVIYEYDIEADIGSKVTNLLGGKGINVCIVPDVDMPTDRDGNRADFIFGNFSIIKRTIPGALYEITLNAYSRDLIKYKLPMLDKNSPSTKTWDIFEVYDQLLEYYRITSPLMLQAELDRITQKGTNKDDNFIRSRIKEHLDEVYEEGINLWLPLQNPRSLEEVIYDLMQKKYPICFGPISYRDVNGTYIESTASNILIGSAYIVRLDKLSNSFAAVSSSKLNHHGLTARLNNNDKNSTPTRRQPTRWGNTEVRIEAAVSDGMSGDPVAELMDRINSPSTHKDIVLNLLGADNPVNIENAVNRSVATRGSNRPVQMTNHLLLCMGARFTNDKQDGN